MRMALFDVLAGKLIGVEVDLEAHTVTRADIGADELDMLPIFERFSKAGVEYRISASDQIAIERGLLFAFQYPATR